MRLFALILFCSSLQAADLYTSCLKNRFCLCRHSDLSIELHRPCYSMDYFSQSKSQTSAVANSDSSNSLCILCIGQSSVTYTVHISNERLRSIGVEKDSSIVSEEQFNETLQALERFDNAIPPHMEIDGRAYTIATALSKLQDSVQLYGDVTEKQLLCITEDGTKTMLVQNSQSMNVEDLDRSLFDGVRVIYVDEKTITDEKLVQAIEEIALQEEAQLFII